MTNFDERAQYGLPREQAAFFSVAGVDYGVFFVQITNDNPYDCSVDFPDGFKFPEGRNHYDVTFDTKENVTNKTPYQRLGMPAANVGVSVFKHVERIIIDHYNTYNVGLYTFAPADFKLMDVYCRIISKKVHRGFSIEVGLEPVGRANVLRTPKFYV